MDKLSMMTMLLLECGMTRKSTGCNEYGGLGCAKLSRLMHQGGYINPQAADDCSSTTA